MHDSIAGPSTLNTHKEKPMKKIALKLFILGALGSALVAANALPYCPPPCMLAIGSFPHCVCPGK